MGPYLGGGGSELAAAALSARGFSSMHVLHTNRQGKSFTKSLKKWIALTFLDDDDDSSR